MKTPKAFASLVLAGCMLLSACGGGGGTSTSTGSGGNGGATNTASGDSGRYLESVVTPPMGEDDYMPQLLKAADGGLICFNDDLTRRFDSADGGKTWAESEGPGAGITGIATYDKLTLLSDGSILTSVTTQEAVDNMTYGSVLMRIGADGSTNFVDFDGITDSGYFAAMVPLPEGRVFISYNSYGGTGDVTGDEEDTEGGEEPEDGGILEATNGEAQDGIDENDEDGTGAEENLEAEAADGGAVEVEDDGDENGGNTSNTAYNRQETNAIFDAATGEKLKDIPIASDNGVSTAATDGKDLYLIDYGSTIKAYDTEGNQLPFEASFPQDDINLYLGTLAFGADGTLYMANSKGIFALDEEGGVETILDGTGYTLGDPSAIPDSLFVLENGSFIVRLYSNDGYQFHLYEWDPDATIDPDKVINVWALRDSNTLRAAIGKFREKHPDGMVNLEVALSDEGGLSANDAIRALNTEILNGGGPDVMLLDGTPLESYIDKGVLADLSGLVDTGTYYQNLLEQAKSDNGLYFIPLRVTIPVLAANDGYMSDSIDEFIELMKQNPGANADLETSLDYRSEEERSLISFQNFNELWQQMWSANAPAVVKGTELNSANLETFLKNLKEISDYNGYGSMAADEYTLGGMMGFGIGGGATSLIEGSLMAHLMGSANSSMFTAGDVVVVNFLRDQTTITMGGVVENQPAGASFGLLPGIETGVWNPSLLAGINASSQKQAVAADFISLMLSDEVQGVRLADGFAVTESGMGKQVDSLREAFEFDSGYMELGEFNALFNSLTTMNLVDEEVGEKVYEYALPYCQGTISLEDAINGIEGSVKNYLAERQ